jgi:hypothetical protein
MTWSFPPRAPNLPADPPPSDEDDKDGGDEGRGGEGAGAPRLKPNLDEPLGQGDAGEGGGEGSGGEEGDGSPPRPDELHCFGPWEFHASKLMLYNRLQKRRLMLEKLNSPSSVMRVIVALGTQQGWDADNLVKSLDHAARARFGKTLYQVFAHVQDAATIDWKKGSLKPEPPRAPGMPR